MPPKKIEWGDVPNEEHVKEKESAGKWIECNVCHQVIRVRTTFGFTEWLNHCSSAKHCEKVKTNDLNNTTTKLISYFTSKPVVQHKPSTLKFNSDKRSKIHCHDQYLVTGKLLNYYKYNKYKKNDELCDTTFIFSL